MYGSAVASEPRAARTRRTSNRHYGKVFAVRSMEKLRRVKNSERQSCLCHFALGTASPARYTESRTRVRLPANTLARAIRCLCLLPVGDTGASRWSCANCVALRCLPWGRRRVASRIGVPLAPPSGTPKRHRRARLGALSRVRTPLYALAGSRHDSLPTAPLPLGTPHTNSHALSISTRRSRVDMPWASRLARTCEKTCRTS